MMSQVNDGISEQFLQMHQLGELRVPAGRVMHRQRPLPRVYAFETPENSPMDSVELPHDARAAKDPRAGARACGINSVEERSREIESPGKDT